MRHFYLQLSHCVSTFAVLMENITHTNTKSITHNNCKDMIKSIKPSKRARLRLLPEEHEWLKSYVEDRDNAPFATIKHNTRIAHHTVVSIVETGAAERDVIYRMRDFIKAFRNQ